MLWLRGKVETRVPCLPAGRDSPYLLKMKFLKLLNKKDLFGKICLLRVDLNIAEREAKNSPRINGILPTIKFLTNNGAKVIILSHRGRPKNFDKKQSLRPFAGVLLKLLNKQVHFINFNIGKSDFLRKFDFLRLKNSPPGVIFLLENLRFLAGEEKNDAKLAKQLASLADFYVNDAFSVCHRNAASVVAITKFLPSYAGLLLENEIKNLSAVMKYPKHPLVVILGGAKISDKIGLIKNFSAKADYFLIGGGMAHNFLKAQGLPIGDSIFEESTVNFARGLLGNKKIILPIDYAINKNKILDIGPNTARLYSDMIKKAKTIIWNGPMGYFEDKRFAKGSETIAKAILESRAFSVVGGGETTTLFQNSKFIIHNSNIFISTGGGAMLEYLASKKLPGVEALK